MKRPFGWSASPGTALVLVMVLFVTACTTGPVVSSETPASASPAATPATSLTTSPTAVASPAASVGVTEFPGVSDDVAPGTYLWAAGEATPADITFTMPAGWMSRYGIAHKDRGGPGEIAVGNWIIANVYRDPCQWQGSLLNPAVGPAVEDLATALVAQKGRNATAPTDVMLGGFPATRIELSIPADIDMATCDEGVMRTWVAPGGDTALDNGTENLGMHPGQLNVVYIVDVSGDRLVIDTWHMPDTSATDLAELDGVLASMRIEH
ncbi:MAG: hypothetical protein K0S97_57 [Chloroflexota bacterium]|nr:hypothetical protein [Chloroflexota bacterium]